MSYGGSFRAAIAGCLVAVIFVGCGSAAADDYAPDGSVVVTAVVRPVRIVVVNDGGSITEVLSNGPGVIIPTVHRGNPDGPTVTLTPAVSKQYTAIIRRADTHKTGVIYRLEQPRHSTLPPDWRVASGAGRVRSLMLPGLRLF